MSNNIKLKKGLELPLEGAAEKKVVLEARPDVVAVKPTDFAGLTPRLLVKEGDTVKAGSPLFADKMHPDILFASPVSGTVKAVVRGDKRKLLAVTVKADATQVYEDFGAGKVSGMSADQIRALLLRSGLWGSIIQRPYGIVADPDVKPKAVFVSAFNSAPNAADTAFVLKDAAADFQTGIDAIAKMTGVEVHLSFNASDYESHPLAKTTGVTVHVFEGVHPAGNVGVQIHNISPIRKGETVWTLSPVLVAATGRLITTGRLDLTRLFAVTGSQAKRPAYVKGIAGMSVSAVSTLFEAEGTRCISGDVFSGKNVGADGFTGWFDNQLSFIREGDYREMFGWMNPVRSKQYSTSHAYFSWLCPKKKYAMDTNIHGGVRAFMFNNVYSDVLPMHIFPVYLAKACIAQDIDKMEKFGIYEVLPEDFATCEFVCPSKIEWQSIIADGITLMLKEMA